MRLEKFLPGSLLSGYVKSTVPFLFVYLHLSFLSGSEKQEQVTQRDNQKDIKRAKRGQIYKELELL